MSIDKATPEEWNALRKKTATPVADTWNHIYDDDNEPNDHPLYGDYKYDNVHRPEHYNTGSIECIEAIKGMLNHDEYIGYLRGNALKYMWRFRYKKSPIEDLRKARWYEERLITHMLENPSDK
jgi:hypothetical protein